MKTSFRVAFIIVILSIMPFTLLISPSAIGQDKKPDKVPLTLQKSQGQLLQLRDYGLKKVDLPLNEVVETKALRFFQPKENSDDNQADTSQPALKVVPVKIMLTEYKEAQDFDEEYILREIDPSNEGSIFFILHNIDIPDEIHNVQTYHINDYLKFNSFSGESAQDVYDTPLGSLRFFYENITIDENWVPISGRISEKCLTVEFKGKKAYLDNRLGDDDGIGITWIGNLDNDDIPDFIMELGCHYNADMQVLFLSSIAKDGQLYGVVIGPRNLGC